VEANHPAYARCNEVNDDWFQVLLEVTHLSLGHVRKGELLTIVMVNNLRLASFVPDQPPIWNKTRDVLIQLKSFRKRVVPSINSNSQSEWIIIEGPNHSFGGGGEDNNDSYHTSDAVPPLRNMIRIAKAKGNAKRGCELSLRLAERYLSP